MNKLKLKGDEIIVDNGSGTGNFCFDVARLYPGATLIGIEKSFELTVISQKKKIEKQLDNVHFVNGDILEMSLVSFDVSCMYFPITVIMDDFYERIPAKLMEMKPDQRLVIWFKLPDSDKELEGRDILGEILLSKYSGYRKCKLHAYGFV